MEVEVKTRFDRFLDLLDEEIKRRPHDGGQEAFWRLLGMFHGWRFPATPEAFKAFAVIISEKIENPSDRFWIFLTIDNALKRLREEEGE